MRAAPAADPPTAGSALGIEAPTPATNPPRVHGVHFRLAAAHGNMPANGSAGVPIRRPR